MIVPVVEILLVVVLVALVAFLIIALAVGLLLGVISLRVLWKINGILGWFGRGKPERQKPRRK